MVYDLRPRVSPQGTESIRPMPYGSFVSSNARTRLGFSLRDIGQLIELRARPAEGCAAVASRPPGIGCPIIGALNDDTYDYGASS